MGAGVVGTQFQRVNIVVQGPTGKKHHSLWTFATGVRSILYKAGVKVSRHDVVFPAKTLGPSHTIVVHDAVPVTIRTPSRTERIWATEYTVGAVLALAQIHPSPQEVVEPDRGTRITAPTTINVIRRYWVTKHITLRIPFAVQHRPDPRLAQGKSLIHQAGIYGKRVKTLRELVQAGRVVKVVDLGTRRVEPSRPEIIEYGAARPVSRGGPVLQFARVIPMVATAYWPDPAWSSGYTYTGLKAQYGIAAVDPTVIPLGTRLYIPGYGFALAADIGGAIKGDRIDLCYDTLAQADAWGLRDVNVYVLGPAAK